MAARRSGLSACCASISCSNGSICRIRRGDFKSVADLEHAIAAYIREHNKTATVLWTKPADAILVKLTRLPVSSE